MASQRWILGGLGVAAVLFLAEGVNGAEPLEVTPLVHKTTPAAADTQSGQTPVQEVHWRGWRGYGFYGGYGYRPRYYGYGYYRPRYYGYSYYRPRYYGYSYYRPRYYGYWPGYYNYGYSYPRVSFSIGGYGGYGGYWGGYGGVYGYGYAPYGCY